MAVRIQHFTDKYQKGIDEMMKEISEEFNLHMSPSKNIFQSTKPIMYWVAELDGLVVGTVGVIILHNNAAELKRMFVKKTFRGTNNGVSHPLLETALNYLKQKGIKTLFLGTKTEFKAAQHFYKKNRFIQIHRDRLPPDYEHHPTDDLFFKLNLGSLKKNKNSNLHYREATPKDSDQLSKLRTRFLLELTPHQSKKEIDTLRTQLTEYFETNIREGSIIVWVAEVNNIIVASSTMVLWKPPLSFSSLRKNGQGYILNMYTLNEYRKQGIGTKLLRNSISRARELNLEKVHLHATKNGFQLYRNERFVSPTYPELVLKLK